MTIKRVFGLATLLAALKFVCDVIDRHSQSVRAYVPESRRAEYDTAISVIRASCGVIRAIDFLADSIGANT